MATRVTQVQASTGQGASIPLSIHNMFPVAVLVVVSATATYNVEYTLDDIPNLPANVSPVWQPFSAMTAKTATADLAITFPVAFIRLNTSANTGTVTMKVLQGDNVN